MLLSPRPSSITSRIVALGSLASLAAASLAHSQVVIDVDATETHQTMRGWEATSYSAFESPSFPAAADAIFDLAVDAGLDRIRLEVRSGSENEDYWQQYQDGTIDYDFWRSHRYATVNDNADPFDIDPAGFHFTEVDSVVSWTVNPLRNRLAARGEDLYVNLCYVAFTSQIGGGLAYHHDDPEEYAEFIEALWLHLDATWGLVPDGLEILLEPDLVAEWSGSGVGEAIVAATDRLADHGYHPDVIAPSTTSMANAITYFDALAAVPGAVDVLTEISYHRYTGVSEANLLALADRAATYGIGTSMLEWWTGQNGYETLHQDLELGVNVAWQQGVVAGVGPGGSAWTYLDDSGPGDPEVHLNSMTTFTSLYYRWVRRGALRIGATSSSAVADPLAFVNVDGRTTVVVKTDAATDLTVDGLPAGSYGITYGTSGVDTVDLPEVILDEGEPLATSIPWAGVITVHREDVPLGVDDVAPGGGPFVGVPQVVTPTRAGSTVTFRLEASAVVTAELLDIRGRRVAILATDADLDPGTHTLVWDGTDRAGRAVGPGVYTIVLRSGGVAVGTKLVMLGL